MANPTSSLDERVRAALAAHPQPPTAAQLAHELAATPEQIRAAVQELRAAGHTVALAGDPTNAADATAVVQPQHPALSPRLARMHAFIMEQGTPPTAAQVAAYLDVPQRRVYTYVYELRRRGIAVTLTEMPRRARSTQVYQQRQVTGELPPRQAQILAFVREAAARGARPTGKEIADALGLARNKVTEILGVLRTHGLVRLYEPRDGWAPTESAAAPTRGPITLQMLQALVDACGAVRLDAPGLVTTRGHLTLEQRAERRVVSRSQQIDARTGLNALAELLQLPRDQPLPPELVSWDGHDWACVAQLEAAYTKRAQAKHRGPGPFNPRTVAAGRSKVLGGVRIALDLAANHDHIARAVAQRPTSGIATPFLDVLPAWVERVTATGASHEVALNGCRILARYATALGAPTPATTNWAQVRERIAADACSGQLRGARGTFSRSHRTLTDARRAYCALDELVQAGGPWPRPSEVRATSRLCLVSTAAIAAAAERQDWSGWTTPDGQRLAGLIDGPYGLMRYAIWATADPLGLTQADLPPREYPDPQGGPGKRARCRIGLETLRSRLTMLATFCGWATQQAGRDWTRCGVLDLLEPRLTLLAEYRAWHEREGAVPRAQLAKLARDLSVLACPFGQAIALQHGDKERATQLWATHTALKRLVTEFTPTLEEQRKQIAQIARAWSRGGRPGLLRLYDLKELLVGEAERIVGMTKAEQVAALEAGRRGWQTHAWAIAIRNAFAVNLGRRVPMRERALRGLTANTRAELTPSERLRFGWWDQERPAGWPPERQLARWEGGIVLQVPKALIKGGRDYEPAWIAAADCAPFGATAEARLAFGAEVELDRALLQLYLAPGGALEVLTRAPEAGAFRPPAWLLVTRRGKRFGRGDLSKLFKRLIHRYGPALGLSVEALRTMQGARGIHIIRGLFGTYWAPRNLRYAQLMLQHRSPEMTSKLYDGSTERDLRMWVPAAQLLGGAAPVESELERLQRRIGELEALLAQYAALVAGQQRDGAA